MSDRRRRGRRPCRSRLAVAASAALLTSCLAACSGIPTSGPVHPGDAIGVERDGADEPGTRVLPQSPRRGSSQQQIIEGFLNASASFDNDHGVAREFLTSDAAKTWNPSAGATIYDNSVTTGNDSYEILPSAPDDVIFSATQVATISVQGEYDNATGPLVQDFRMRKVAGDWRIASPPTGLLLTQHDVDRAYRTYDIYFPDPGRTGLVPNQVLLPIGTEASTSTALMRALVAGPTEWLAPAVQTAIPTGTKLVVDSAPIVDGVVQVDLTAPAATANAREEVALSAQVVWTLKALNQVTAVRITVDGVPLRGVPAVQRVDDSWAQWGPDWPDPVLVPTVNAYYVGKDRLLSLVADKPQPVPGVLGNGSFGLHDPAVSYNQTDLRVAGLDATRHRLYVTSLIGGDKPPAPVLSNATRLTAPTWDRINNVWTVDQQAKKSVVWVVAPDVEPKQVQTENLPAGRIMAMRISRDGARVALVVQPPGGTVGQVYVGRVERGAGKLTLSGFKPIKSQFSDTTDVAWASADRLLLLGRTAPGTPLQPMLVDLMGLFGRALGPIDPSTVSTESIVSITAAPLHEVLAATSAGKIYRYLSIGWEELAVGSDAAYPG